MRNWVSLIIKMIFEFLKKVFGFADESSRKRQFSEVDVNNISEFSSPIKRHRSNHIKMPNGKDIIEIEDDDDDDIIICDDKTFKPPQLKHRHTVAPCHLLRCPAYYCNNGHASNHQHKPTSCVKQNKKMNHISGKSRLNCMAANVTKPSTLGKSYQLREKEQYSLLLKTFLPQRVQILNSNPELRKIPTKPIETIDIENCEPSPSIVTSPETFRTPKSSTPSRWFTPMTQLPNTSTSSYGKSIVEEIKLDDSDDAITNETYFRSPKTTKKSNENRVEKLVARSATQIVPKNTLRDKLAVKDVLREDFVPRVAERYNERNEKRIREAEELKKVTRVLSKHNRLSREVALEIQLARSMKLSEAVLEEADYFQEPELPELTQQMMKQVKNALIPRPPDQVLVQSFGLRITRKDIHTLADLNWLNDEVINFYMNLLIERGGKDNFPSVYTMNTFFYPKLLSGGHGSLKRWTRKVDIFAQDIVVVPIHLGMHWCMSIIDFRDKSIRYYDSMGGENPKCLVSLRQYLEDECRDKKKQNYDTSDWVLESMADIPQQMNGSDCGVFSCTFAEYICANKKLTFTQDDMPYFRNKMVYEILNVKLL